jgi:hypothetical protein
MDEDAQVEAIIKSKFIEKPNAVLYTPSGGAEQTEFEYEIITNECGELINIVITKDGVPIISYLDVLNPVDNCVGFFAAVPPLLASLGITWGDIALILGFVAAAAVVSQADLNKLSLYFLRPEDVSATRVHVNLTLEIYIYKAFDIVIGVKINNDLVTLKEFTKDPNSLKKGKYYYAFTYKSNMYIVPLEINKSRAETIMSMGDSFHAGGFTHSIYTREKNDASAISKSIIPNRDGFWHAAHSHYGEHGFFDHYHKYKNPGAKNDTSHLKAHAFYGDPTGAFYDQK